jgi:hypothetical protein
MLINEHPAIDQTAKAKTVFGSMPHTALQRLFGVQFHNPVELCRFFFGLQNLRLSPQFWQPIHGPHAGSGLLNSCVTS